MRQPEDNQSSHDGCIISGIFERNNELWFIDIDMVDLRSNSLAAEPTVRKCACTHLLLLYWNFDINQILKMYAVICNFIYLLLSEMQILNMDYKWLGQIFISVGRLQKNFRINSSEYE